MFDFENFPVYQKAELVYKKLHVFFESKSVDKTLREQLKRASLSIVLNIAEGAGKYTKNDKKNFYVISKGSVNECVAIIRILKMDRLISNELFDIIYDDLQQTARMLSSLINFMSK